MTRNNGHYAVQGHSRLSIFGTNGKPICDLLQVKILTYILSGTVSPLLQITGEIFAFDRGYLPLIQFGPRPINTRLQNLTSPN